ncbi:hypothetical protein SI65_00681 [Aspergillus cristatus]|uniref:C2H2-type domain-containing protein n=1 Tax=Aspergillus cristatus TaxID=573508 RepID=A0A1E3BQ53_ASPCR|nr:hypothetical protein SI65_00681 [Aspergillus cristatus]
MSTCDAIPALVDTKEKPYSCPCGWSFSRKDLLIRHERLSHSSNGNRGRTQGSTSSPLRSTESAQADLPQAPSQHHQQDLDLADLALPSDPMLLSPIDDLFSSHGDPMLDFNRSLNSAELNMDWDAYLADTVSVPEGVQPKNATGQQFTPDSTDFSSRVPDDLSGDNDFRELKPVSFPWLISELQRLQFNDTLIPQFILPTRASIARYMSGYVDGFTDHHPFIHVPTLRILSYHRSPETILALLSIGAQYRYETKTARALYQSSRSIVLERLRKGELYPLIGDISHSQHESTSDTASSDNVDRTRALLLPATYCLWQNQASLTQECFEYQGLIARSIPQPGLLETLKETGYGWSQWIRLETDELSSLDGVS